MQKALANVGVDPSFICSRTKPMRKATSMWLSAARLSLQRELSVSDEADWLLGEYTAGTDANWGDIACLAAFP